MEVPSMLRGESLKRLLQGVVLGVVLTVVIGFNWLHYGFGWTLGGTAETMASHRVDVALVAAYTPVCVEKFVGPADDAKWEEFAKVASWRRDAFVKEAGLATIPGATEPNSSVADACAGVLTKLLEARAPKK
jgi:hypothetical protein